MRLPARIADTARCAETSLGPISKGFEIIMADPSMEQRRDCNVAKGHRRTFQYFYVVNFNSIFGINNHAAGS
jgi:hypothetical protein